MNNFKLLSLPVAAGIFIGLSGCGGSSNGNGLVASSPFRNSWAGSWTDQASDTGTAAISVGGDGTFSGTFKDTDEAPTATVSGTIASDGTTTMNIAFPGVASYAISGMLTQSGNTLSGTLAGTDSGGAPVSDTFTLKRKFGL